MTESLLIVGASARAAAFSALRAGLRPACADLFADVDLQRRCAITRLTARYPHGFQRFLDCHPPGPWMYAGGLENWPALVRRMARRRPLWGNDAETLRRARHPWLVRRILRTAGLSAPAVRRRAPSSGRWLVKPRCGAGGVGIRFWDRSVRLESLTYFQQFIDGVPCSALYVADGEQCRLLGITRQLVGEGWLHAAAFRYCGSIGPLTPTDGLRKCLEQLGSALARHCGLRGLLGVDGVLREGAFWPVEINPRYTASVEVLEYAAGAALLAYHAHVFMGGKVASLAPPAAPVDRCIGKAILFARHDLRFPDDGPWMAELRSPTPIHELPSFADIPAAGQIIERGRPILTLFAEAASEAACEEALRQRVASLN